MDDDNRDLSVIMITLSVLINSLFIFMFSSAASFIGMEPLGALSVVFVVVVLWSVSYFVYVNRKSLMLGVGGK